MKITGYKQLTERMKRVIETNLVQADLKSHISDYVYIANDGYIDYVQWRYEAGEN